MSNSSPILLRCSATPDFSHLERAERLSKEKQPEWPIGADAWKVSGRGIGLWSAGGGVVGTVLGVMGDTGVGTFALTTAFNSACMGCVFFGMRELVFSPLLLKAGLTSDHRRQMKLAIERANGKARSNTKIGGELSSLGPETWGDIRQRRVMDSALAGGFTATLGPALYRKILGYGGFKVVAPTVGMVTITTAFASATSGLVQWVSNELRIHQAKMYGAYDAVGPIPEVDIHAVRRDQRKALMDTLTVAQQEAFKQTASIPVDNLSGGSPEVSEQAGSMGQRKEEKLPWWSFRRFMSESLPSVTTLTEEEYLKRLEDQRVTWIDELAEVRAQLASLGEDRVVELEPIDIARLQS
ncbi:hypothetical protein [Phaffia rhodozyma]|uniref:Uncharacterized protein n=1 Tax=Phaffia rhodozyma TaxID=264483 RepID=A0A0F7SIF6_PHARH|nr:hypothetical protein [Phaffia rhodozyma]